MGLQAQATISETAYREAEDRVIPKLKHIPCETMEQAIDDAVEAVSCEAMLYVGGGGYSLHCDGRPKTAEEVQEFRERLRNRLTYFLNQAKKYL